MEDPQFFLIIFNLIELVNVLNPDNTDALFKLIKHPFLLLGGLLGVVLKTAQQFFKSFTLYDSHHNVIVICYI